MQHRNVLRVSVSKLIRTSLPGVVRCSVRALPLLVLLVVIGRPQGQIVLVGPRQVVRTRNPRIGVHTRLTDEVEEWKVKRTLEMVREMGAPWIVEYFPWGYYEPEKGRYDWAHPDMVVDHAVAQGLTVIARVDFVPSWARPTETTFRYLDEERFADYGDFIYAFVDHFRGRVSHILIWNEPNLSFEWGYRAVDPDSYTRLLKHAYRRAKEANPDVRVLAAGLAPTLAPPGSEWGMNDLEYLQRMYDAGVKGHFDLMAVHAYGWRFSPDDPADGEIINFARAELVREVMVRNGDGDTKVIITEGGWNDHPRWTKAVRPYQRVEYTVRAYERALDEWDWCEAVCLWAFRYPRPARNYQDYFTFVSTDFIAKPIYSAVQSYAAGEQRPSNDE